MDAQLAASDETCKSTDLRQLQNTIEFMDSISQEGCSEIITIAKLTLAFLERADGVDDVETVVQAIQAIRLRAATMEDGINCEASELGCGHKDGATQPVSARQLRAPSPGR